MAARRTPKDTASKPRNCTTPRDVYQASRPLHETEGPDVVRDAREWTVRNIRSRRQGQAKTDDNDNQVARCAVTRSMVVAWLPSGPTRSGRSIWSACMSDVFAG